MSEDLTSLLNNHHADLSPFSEPPFSCKAIREQLQQGPESTDVIAYVGDLEAGEIGRLSKCTVCGRDTKWVVDR
jgi:hypothetical protein